MKLPEIDPSLFASRVPKAADGKNNAKGDDEALRKTAHQFEAIFVQSMFKTMRSTVGDGGLLPKSQGEQVFRDLMDMEIAKAASEQGKLGIGEALFRQLQKKEGPETPEK